MSNDSLIYGDVIKSEDSDKWGEAMNEEMKALTKKKAFKVTKLPAKKRAICNKWVHKIKRDPTGNILKCKARLVAQGFSQREGIDFNETFAPVAKMTSIRLQIEVAAARRWYIHQRDIKTAFLNGDIDEEIYIR